jgi:signal transduction histidine kinase
VPKSLQQRLITGGFVVASAIIAALFLLAYQSNSQFVQWNSLAAHTQEDLRALDEYTAAVKAAQTASVSYYTKGADSQIQAFAVGNAQARAALEKIKTLTANDPEQQDNLAALLPLNEQAFDLLQRVMDMRKAGKSGTEALKPINEEAKRISPPFAKTLAAMTTEENHLLETRTATAGIENRKVRRLLLSGGISVAVIMLALFFLFLRENSVRARAEQKLGEANSKLEFQNAQLAATNKELESFSYSVSHDLRAPLRGIDGMSQALLEDYADRLDSQGKDYLGRVRLGVQRMGCLIDDLLNLSRITRAEIRSEKVDLSEMAGSIASELRNTQPERKADFIIRPKIEVKGDPHLMRVALQNLLANSWKFTSRQPRACIEFGQIAENGHSVFFVKDNGAGFDPAYSKRLFGVFQRLHSNADFPGTGIGLATVQRVIHRHGGKIWAESEAGQGATFFFTVLSGTTG